MTLACALAVLAVASWPTPRYPMVTAAGPTRGVQPVATPRPRGLRRTRGAGGRGGGGDADLLAMLAATAAGLRAGLTQADALGLALESMSDPEGGPRKGWGHRCRRASTFQHVRRSLLSAVAARVALGPVWAELARTSGEPQVHLVARAWRLCEESGAPLAEALDVAADLVRARLARARRIAINTAGPRATMNLLTALPVAGPVLGLVVGVDPSTLLGSPVVLSSMAAGTILLVVGRWWARSLVASLMRAEVVA